jgi:hypothetical protein
MISVISDNVSTVGYDPPSQVLRVAFRSGGVYDYFGVHPYLYDSMLLTHPWRRVGRVVRGHAYRRVA